MQNQILPMSLIPQKAEAGPGGAKTPTETKKTPWYATNRLFWILFGVGALIAVVHSYMSGHNVLWLFELKTISPVAKPIDDIAKALGPILALALAIERIVETVFDIFERNLSNVAQLGLSGVQSFDHLTKQAEEARTELDQLNNKLTGAALEEKPAITKKIEEAEGRLTSIGTYLSNLPKDTLYLSWKRYISIWLSLFLGLVVAILTDEGLFEYLNLPMIRFVDMILTGFVIGAGSGPMHSLIGILQGAKTSLENIRTTVVDIEPLRAEIRNLEGRLPQKR